LPTVITQTTPNMRIESEEIFGPVLTVTAFESEVEVVALHNAVPTGLSTSVWTQDSERAERLARALETGCVNVNNVMLTEGNPALPFGGVKYSGFGRMKGVEGLRGMTRSKAVMLDPTRGKPEPNWYPYSAQKLALTQQLLAAVLRRSPLRYLEIAKAGLGIERLVRRLARTAP
jgi:delta 1-pyrroline-5-carboxylate dehydrogenase